MPPSRSPPPSSAPPLRRPTAARAVRRCCAALVLLLAVVASGLVLRPRPVQRADEREHRHGPAGRRAESAEAAERLAQSGHCRRPPGARGLQPRGRRAAHRGRPGRARPRAARSSRRLGGPGPPAEPVLGRARARSRPSRCCCSARPVRRRQRGRGRAAARRRPRGDLPDGLRAQVTGGPAFRADIGAVFEGADVTLLLATAGVVAALLLLTYRSPFLWLVPLRGRRAR